VPKEPNPRQRDLIEAVDGLVLADAGAGTGKTFAVSQRYRHVVGARDVEPEDILLVTFTNQAADEMRERILQTSDLPPESLRSAPITTFHSLCHRILEGYGFHAPRHLGIDEPLSPETRILEDEVVEAREFQDHLRRYRRENPEHEEVLGALRDPSSLLDLVKQLAARGVFPTEDGWYRGGEAEMLGDREAFMEAFREANASDGSRQSDLREDLRGWDDRLLLSDAPDEDELRGPRGTKQVDAAWAREAFDEDRERLLEAVRGVYHGYLEHCLRRNYLNFAFLQTLAYVLLVEEPDVREALARPYVMIDEFQDTSEVQFKLALLFCAEPNLCVVGDWKQSIYGFQYASVENITRFEERLGRYADELDDEADRVPFEPGDVDVTGVDLTLNYRSTQPVLDLAEEALTIPATGSEPVDAEAIRERVVSLTAEAADAFDEGTRLEGRLATGDEAPVVLEALAEIVGNDDYRVRDPDTGVPRPPTWGDVAVLTRTQRFAMELEEAAREGDVPLAFEGGVDLYNTDAAKLVLAWLRILDDPRSERGWSVVLEEAGHTLEEVRAYLGQSDEVEGAVDFPEDLWSFRSRLEDLPDVGAVAAAVCRRYGIGGGFAAGLVQAASNLGAGPRTPRGEAARLLEEHLRNRTRVDVEDHPGGDVATCQTVHAAKGLEYPIVILADVNQGRFPSTRGGSSDVVRFRDPVGLRRTRLVADPDGDGPHPYENWKARFLHHCLPPTYGEERRLLYVALTRARDHLVVTAEEDRASRFFTGLSEAGLDVDRVDPPESLPEVELEADEEPPLELEVPEDDRPAAVPVNALVPAAGFEGYRGKGRAFGTRVHRFAARYAAGAGAEASNADEEHAARAVDALREGGADVRPEVPCRLPVTVAGRRVVVDGKIDLLAVGEDQVTVLDWKTVEAGAGLEAFRDQVGLYGAVAAQLHPEKEVTCQVVYTENGEAKSVPAWSLDQVRERLEEHLAGDA
jgi:superfamily I DNA/RNA helicase